MDFIHPLYYIICVQWRRIVMNFDDWCPLLFMVKQFYWNIELSIRPKAVIYGEEYIRPTWL